MSQFQVDHTGLKAKRSQHNDLFSQSYFTREITHPLQLI